MEDLTDNEAEEQLRRWWGENWLWIFGGIALGLGMLWGWQYWQRTRMEQAQHDVAAYQSVIMALGQDKFDAAVVEAKALRDERPASPYADQSDLALARAAVEMRKLDEAGQHLRLVMDGSRDAELRSIARSRLARVLTEQARYDDALALLDVPDAGAYAPLYHELRGDAFAAKGDASASRSEYDKALAAQGAEPGTSRGYLELKRDALPAAAATGTAIGPVDGGVATSEAQGK